MSGDAQLEPGARFRLSALGAKRCPKLVQRSGTIIDVTRTGSAFRVPFDGTKLVRTIHRTYVMPATEPAGTRCDVLSASNEAIAKLGLARIIRV